MGSPNAWVNAALRIGISALGSTRVFRAGALLSDRYHDRSVTLGVLRYESWPSAQPTCSFSEQVHLYLTDIHDRSSSWDALRYESLPSAQPTFSFSEQVHFYPTDIHGRSSSWDALRYESRLLARRQLSFSCVRFCKAFCCSLPIS